MVSVAVNGVALSEFTTAAVTEMVQLAEAAMLLPQVLLSVKFWLERLMLWTAIAEVLGLVRVIVCGAESCEKLSDVGDRESAPLPATAVPVSAMAAGSLVTLLAIVR
jgi:hypothetical protein